MKRSLVTIVDYQMGNLFSAAKAFEAVGATTVLTHNPDKIRNAERVFFPGVGAFGDCLEHLNRFGLVEALREYVASGKPLMGVCLGLQALFEQSEEFGNHKGLGILSGKVIPFAKDLDLRIPHMGWNSVDVCTSHAKHSLWRSIPDKRHFYFVHSYYVKPSKNEILSAKCSYGVDFAAAVQYQNIFATQFHPEKSADQGLQLLNNFTHWEP